MRVINVQVYTEEGVFVPGEIETENGKVSKVIIDGTKSGNVEDSEVIDGEGAYAIPGMIDIHFHGCKGYDFCDGTREAFEEIAKYEASIGVTAISPATMTLPVPELERILAQAAAYRLEKSEKDCGIQADLVGVNMEGPFISAAKKGAQDEKNIILS